MSGGYNHEVVKALFPLACAEVTQLVCGDVLDESQRRDEHIRAPLWSNATRDFPPFADTISDLRVTLASARTVRAQDPRSLIRVDGFFQRFADPIARRLLAAITIARASGKEDLLQEAQMVSQELYIAHKDQRLQEINARQIVEGVLSGRFTLRATKKTTRRVMHSSSH